MMTLTLQGKSYPLKETIGEIKKENSRKAIIFLGGVHGNEPSGYTALCQVFPELQKLEEHLTGDVYFFAGNIRALQEKKRFIDKDLNRIWLHKNINKVKSGELNEENATNEWIDFIRLYKRIKAVVDSGQEIYVIDLHTTSAPSIPFITINDMIKNRNYSQKFPLPIILGIEEYLSGPLLSYMNEFGHVSMAFEAGQHDAEISVKSQVAFIWTALANGGFLTPKEIPNYKDQNEVLASQHNMAGEVFEVRYRKAIVPEKEFVMKPGYTNFMPINKDETVAHENGAAIKTHEGGRIFMPLYQKEGDDGYFIIRRVPGWALGLSKMLRKVQFEALLAVLPGVHRSKVNPHTLIVNPRVAKFLTNELFHLLGYRRKVRSGKQLIFSRREITND